MFKKLPNLIATLLLSLVVLGLLWSQNSLTALRLPQPDRPAELYSNQTQDDLKRTFLAAIQRAKTSILFIIYTLNDRQIIEALKERAEAGVDVKVICDAKACPQAQKKLGQNVTTLKRSPPGLMHQKILVIDGEEVWLGSANMTTESLQMHGNLVTALHQKEMAGMITAKSAGMGSQGVALSFPHQDFLVADQRVELWFLPDNRQAIDHLTQLIRSAKKTIRVAMFTWTHPILTQEVIDAHNRGLDVEVMIDHYAGKGSGAQVFKRLQEAGVSAHLSPGGPLLHHKFMYLDESILVNGSANWTRAAFTQNDDCFMILHQLTKDQQRVMNGLWKVIWAEKEE